MNLTPPPATENVKELQRWCEDLYRFLQNPAFHVIRFVPRATCTFDDEGTVYYDSDDDKLKCHNGNTSMAILADILETQVFN